MKTSKIIGIVCWSLVAVLLIGVLVTTLVGGKTIFNPFTLWNYGQNSSSYQHSLNTTEIPAENIDTITIDWTAGIAKMHPYDGDTIQLIEGAAKELNDDEKLTYAVNNNTLSINFMQKRTFWFFFNMPSKSIEVRVPQALYDKMKFVNISTVSADSSIEKFTIDKLEMNTTSGEINVKDIQTNKISLNTTSGNVTLSQVKVNGDVSYNSVSGNLSAADLNCDFLSAHSVSGDHDFSGDIKGVNLDSVSGRLSVAAPVCPNPVSMKTVSGDMQLKTTDKHGFTAGLSSTSGDLSCSFPAIMSDKKAVVGDGSAQVSFDSVSGDALISAYNTVE